MSIKHSLTNEELNDRFDNTFALVSHAISLARDIVHKGELLGTNPVKEILQVIDSEEVNEERYYKENGEIDE